MLLHRRSMLALAAVLAGCATGMKTEPETGRQRLAMQNPALNPRNGGISIDAQSLQPGDIILSSSDGITSFGVRVLTMAPVSHASIYLGDQKIADAEPRLVSPGDLLHMREGDVPSVRIHQPLQYVGHLKFQPAAAMAER